MSRMHMTSGLLGLGLVPAGSTTVPLPAAGKGRGDAPTQPLLHFLSQPEAGASGQSGLLLILSVPIQLGAWGVNPLKGISGFIAFAPGISFISHIDPVCWVLIALFYQRSERLSDS